MVSGPSALNSPLLRETLEVSRVALVHDWLTVPGGSEDVFREICDLFPGVVFTSQWDPDRIRFVAGMKVQTSAIQRLPFAKTKHYLFAPLMPRAYRAFDLGDFDLVLTDSHSFAHGVRKRPDALHICYYHTPARSLWVPEIDGRATSGRFRHIKRRVASHLKRLDLEASKSPDYVLANSKTTASRIERFYGRIVDRVIYPPVNVDKWADVQRTGDDLGFLYWGRLIPYKRVDLIIEAVRRSGEKLQIVGSGPEERSLKEQAKGLTNVTFHGRLPDSQLKSLMGRCRAFVFPAYEDFGIVVVEAMAAGLPVIAYGAGGASETVGPEQGVPIEEQTVEALLEGMRRFHDREFDPDSLKSHARQFGVERFREEYREAVDEARHSHRYPATLR